MARGLCWIGCFRLPAGDVEAQVRAGVRIARKRFKLLLAPFVIPVACHRQVRDCAIVARKGPQLLSFYVLGQCSKTRCKELCIV
jgi:hypothetical protein